MVPFSQPRLLYLCLHFAICAPVFHVTALAQLSDEDAEMAAMEAEMAAMDAEMQDPMMSSAGGPGMSRTTGSGSTMGAYLGSFSGLREGFQFGPLLSADLPVFVDTGPKLEREYRQAYQGGNTGLAMSMLFAHMVAEHEQATGITGEMKYSALLRKPVWALRFGVSLEVRGSTANPSPIREGANPARGGRGGGPGDGFDDAEAFDESFDPGMEPEFDPGMDMEMDMDDPMSSGSRPSAATNLAPQVTLTMLDASVEEEMDRTLGLVAEVFAEEFANRFKQGDFGPALNDINPPPPPSNNRLTSRRSRGQQDEKPKPPEAPMSEGFMEMLNQIPESLSIWKPGLVYLGSERWENLLPNARAKRIDFIFHINVSLKEGRDASQIQNVSRIRLVNVNDGANGKSMGTSKAIDSWEAMRLASSGRMGEREYVQEQLKGIFLTIDNKLRVSEMPTISSAMARKRISSLLSSSNMEKLNALAEIRYYQTRNLIEAPEVENAFHIMAGLDGLTMLHGPLKDRLAAARKLAVRAQRPLEN